MAKDDGRGHVYDDDGNDLVPPAPKRWPWIVGVSVLVVALGGFFLSRPPAKAVPVGAPHHVTKKKDPGGSATIPNYQEPPRSSTISIFTPIAALNNKYITWADQQIHAQVPAIPATGPGAGTLTPAILNNPAVMKQFGGPKVPTSLAGITLPTGTPANGSIVGLTPSFLQPLLVGMRGGMWPGITASELTRAFAKAANFLFAINGNNPAGSLQYVDSFSDQGGLDQVLLGNAANPNYPIVKYFTASAANGGMLPRRQVQYLSWVAVVPGHTGASTQISTYSPATISPQGHIVYTFLIENLVDYTVMSGMVHGKLTIGLYKWPVGGVAVALIKNGAQTHWYVTGLGGDGVGNTPTTVYWTAP